MSLYRAKEYPIKQESESIEGYVKRFRNAVQEESSDRIQDFDILQLGNLPRVDVREYGAKGDDSADDTTAIQAAITDNPAVLIPADHTFLVTNLTIPSNRTILGYGYTSCIKSAAAANDNILENSDMSGGNSNIQILNVQLDGNEANQTGGTYLTGIAFQKVDGALIRGCYVHDMWQADPGVFPDSQGIGISSDCKNIIVAYNFCYDSDGNGIHLGTSSDLYGIVVIGNHCYGNAQHGIEVWQCDGVSVVANNCYDNLKGMIFETSTNFSVVANVAYANETHGILVSSSATYGGSQHGTLANNICINNGQDAAGDGITIIGLTGDTTDYIDLIGNRCSDTQGTATQRYGISIGGDYTDYCKIIGNTCVGNDTANYHRFAAGNANGLVRDNEFGESVDVASVGGGTTALPDNGEYFNITGTNNITTLTASWIGRRVVLKFAGILTFTDGGNLKLAGDFVTTADDVISLVSDGTYWIEESRSVN